MHNPILSDYTKTSSIDASRTKFRHFGEWEVYFRDFPAHFNQKYEIGVINTINGQNWYDFYPTRAEALKDFNRLDTFANLKKLVINPIFNRKR